MFAEITCCGVRATARLGCWDEMRGSNKSRTRYGGFGLVCAFFCLFTVSFRPAAGRPDEGSRGPTILLSSMKHLILSLHCTAYAIFGNQVRAQPPLQVAVGSRLRTEQKIFM